MDEKTMMEVSAKEQALLVALRSKFRFGEVTIIMRDGVPTRLRIVEVYDNLEDICKSEVLFGNQPKGRSEKKRR